MMSDFYADNRFLVTGGTGFLGSQIVAALRRRGATVFAPTHRDCNLLDRTQVSKAVWNAEPTVVIHAAGNVGGIGYNQAHPAHLFYDNMQMGLNVLDVCTSRPVRLVMLGTVCSYPSETPTPFREADLWNGYPEATNAPYGVAKRALMTLADACRAQYGMDVMTLIPTNLYGEGDHFGADRSHVIPALIRKFVDAKRDGVPTVTCWGSGNASREFLYVGDAAEAVLLAAEHYHGVEPVNIGSGVETGIWGLAHMIADLIDYRGEILWDTSKPDGQMIRRLDTTRAEAGFGFKAHMTLEDGLRRTMDWYEHEYQPA